jgi:hypothetical protein
MALSTDVRLPKSQTPKFPNKCVVCGQESPDGNVTVSTRAIGWWTWIHWLPGSKYSVQVPACSWCGQRLRRQHWFRWLTVAALVFAAIFTIAPFFEDLPRALRRWTVMGAVIVVLLPWFLWETFFPPPIDLTAYSDSVDYEFRDPAYAEEFAALNEMKTDVSEDDKELAKEE